MNSNDNPGCTAVSEPKGQWFPHVGLQSEGVHYSDTDLAELDAGLEPPRFQDVWGVPYWSRSQVRYMRHLDLQALRAAEAQAEFWRLRCIAEAARKPVPAPAPEPVLQLQGQLLCIGQIGGDTDALRVRGESSPGILLQRDDGTNVLLVGLTEAECRDAAGGFLERCSLVLHAEGAL